MRRADFTHSEIRVTLRVLHVTLQLAPESGGTTEMFYGLVRSLGDKGVESGVVTTTARGKPSTPDWPLTVQAFGESPLSLAWTGHARGIARFLDEEAPHYDLIHIHQLWHYPHFAASLAAQRASKPYIVSPVGALSPWAMSYRAWKKRLYWQVIQKSTLNKAAALHATAEDEVAFARRLGLTSPISLIPNGIDPAQFANLPPRARLRELYPELEGKQIVLFLGRLHPIKGLDLLARAFGGVARARDDVRLLVVGPDTIGYGQHVRAVLGAEGVLSKTLFTGMLTGPDKLAALAGSDMLALSSHSEVRSLVALEAMVCQLPVILTRQCSFPEVTRYGAGLEVDPDPKEFASAMESLLDDPERRRTMGGNGMRLVLEHLTWDHVVGELVDLYARAVESSK